MVQLTPFQGTSNFGAELDSLSDYVNFGVAPSLVLFYWRFQRLDWLGWCVSMVYTICMACRLARFNAGVDFNASKHTRNFFMGVPAPMGALLALTPLVGTFHFQTEFFSQPKVLIPYTLFVSFLLVSRVPTFSSKMINRTLLGEPRLYKWMLGALLLALTGYGFFLHPWLMLLALAGLYILSFPVSYATFTILDKKK